MKYFISIDNHGFIDYVLKSSLSMRNAAERAYNIKEAILAKPIAIFSARMMRSGM